MVSPAPAILSRRRLLGALAASVPLMAVPALAQPQLATPVIPGAPGATPADVTIEGRSLLVDGQPFAVRGVAGDGPLALLPLSLIHI